MDRCRATLVCRQAVLREKDVSGMVELTVVHTAEPNVIGVVPQSFGKPKMQEIGKADVGLGFGRVGE